MSRPFRLRPGVALAAAALAVIAACQSAPVPESAATGPAPAADLDAIRATIDAVNAGAGGSVADQQATLVANVDPARRAEAQRCPTATTTVRLAPVDPGLRPIAGPAPPDATTRTYALPTLIRIYTGHRLTGTDLTTLRLDVHTGDAGTEAYLTPFCVH